MLKIKGAEWKRLYLDNVFWKNTYIKDFKIKVNEEEINNYNYEIENNDEITIISGKIVKKDGREIYLTNFFKSWRETQNSNKKLVSLFDKHLQKLSEDLVKCKINNNKSIMYLLKIHKMLEDIFKQKRSTFNLLNNIFTA